MKQVLFGPTPILEHWKILHWVSSWQHKVRKPSLDAKPLSAPSRHAARAAAALSKQLIEVSRSPACLPSLCATVASAARAPAIQSAVRRF